MSDDILCGEVIEEDVLQEYNIRPQYLGEFVGQEDLKRNLSVFIASAKKRNEPLDHALLYGPPGLGKTTIASIIAKEMGSNFRTTSGPVLSKGADLAAILTNLQENDVLFIDEIHRMPISVEEILYSAMEDYNLDIVVGEGPTARTVKITLPKFTIIGATTRLGLLSTPLKDRFGIPLRLNFYKEFELAKIIDRAATILNVHITDGAATGIAHSARGTPRIALRLLRRIRDFASVSNDNIQNNICIISEKIVIDSLAMLGVDTNGLDSNDLRYINYIWQYCAGGPVGIDTIAAGLFEDKDSIEDNIEPYLMQIGFVQRTPRGRVLTAQAIEFIRIRQE